jgi:hypothetical protein
MLESYVDKLESSPKTPEYDGVAGSRGQESVHMTPKSWLRPLSVCVYHLIPCARPCGRALEVKFKSYAGATLDPPFWKIMIPNNKLSLSLPLLQTHSLYLSGR